ncbi:TPA: hypothetical protein ACN98A_004627, partial [Vibrio parahaemolyticus]
IYRNTLENSKIKLKLMTIKTNNYRQGIIEYLLNNHILHKTKNGKIHVHKLPKELIPKKAS